MPSAKQGKSNTSPPSPSKDSLDVLCKLIEYKFTSLEARIVLVENQINKHLEQFIDMMKDIDKKANSDLSLATSNSKLIAENTERMSSEEIDYQSFLDKIETLETKNKDPTDELEEFKNKSMRKTLIFKNIIQPQQRKIGIKQK